MSVLDYILNHAVDIVLLIFFIVGAWYVYKWVSRKFPKPLTQKDNNNRILREIGVGQNKRKVNFKGIGADLKEAMNAIE